MPRSPGGRAFTGQRLSWYHFRGLTVQRGTGRPCHASSGIHQNALIPITRAYKFTYGDWKEIRQYRILEFFEVKLETITRARPPWHQRAKHHLERKQFMFSYDYSMDSGQVA